MKIAWIAPLMMLARLYAADVTVYVAADNSAAIYPAQSVASGMFRQAGVSVAWRPGTPRPKALSGPVIPIELAAKTPPERSPDALAVAYPYSGAARGITVFYDRIRRRAGRDANLERALLAHVLVHEITHVLEGVDRHSETGVMKAHWSAEDYAAMAVRPLPFDETDLILIAHSRLLHSDQKPLPVR